MFHLLFFSLRFHSLSFPFTNCQQHIRYSIMSYISIFDLVRLTKDWVWFQYNLCNFRNKIGLQLFLHHMMFLLSFSHFVMNSLNLSSQRMFTMNVIANFWILLIYVSVSLSICIFDIFVHGRYFFITELFYANSIICFILIFLRFGTLITSMSLHRMN